MFSVIKSVWLYTSREYCMWKHCDSERTIALNLSQSVWGRALWSACIVCVEPRPKGRDIKEPHQQHFRSIVCPYSSRHAKVEKTAVIRLPLQPSLSHDNGPREVLVYSKRMLFAMHGGGRGIERKTREKCNLRVTLEILFPPLSTSPGWLLLHFHVTTHHRTETVHNIIHHTLIVSLDAAEEHMWVYCQFVIFSSGRIWLWGEISGKSPSLQPTDMVLTAHLSPRTASHSSRCMQATKACFLAFAYPSFSCICSQHPQEWVFSPGLRHLLETPPAPQPKKVQCFQSCLAPPYALGLTQMSAPC